MTVSDLLKLLEECPLVASVQAEPGTPLDDPNSIARLAQASIGQGVRIVRVEGVEDIRAVRLSSDAAIMGLIKSHSEGYEPYITPSLSHIDPLLEAKCDVLSLDGTSRPRPDGSDLAAAVRKVHDGGALVMADVDSPESAAYAMKCGADLLSTTLAGYTKARARTTGPDLDCLREILEIADRPVMGEGRYSVPWHIDAALRIGAAGVVVGGALNDPIKQTAWLKPTSAAKSNVGAVDLGGTWLRFGVFTPDWKLISQDRIPTPKTHAGRAAWVRERARGLERVGVSAGGTIDPVTYKVIESKSIIPDHQGRCLLDYVQDVGISDFRATNDGHASAWGHACLPRFAGRRVATVALGTGVGFGFVAEHRVWMGAHGEYVRLNDLPFRSGTLEGILGGAARCEDADLGEAAQVAIRTVRDMFFPDDMIISGGVGLSTALAAVAKEFGLSSSPFGEDAGLYGAAALVLYPIRR